MDEGFGVDGRVVTRIGQLADYASDVVVQSDGRILVGGQFRKRKPHGTGGDFALVRYDSDGTLDRRFGNDGVVITDVRGDDWMRTVVLQPDGKIVAAGGTVVHGGVF